MTEPPLGDLKQCPAECGDGYLSPVGLTPRPDAGPCVIHTNGIGDMLFHANGQPTHPLRQLIKTLASYVRETCGRPPDIVITPEALQRYYHLHRVAHEPHPWQQVFNHRRSSLSSLYRKLAVEHYLIPEGPQDRPTVPSMTLTGFEAWSIQLILAYPGVEYRRLAQVSQQVTFGAGGELTECIARELHRNHFPARPHTLVADRLRSALIDHCQLTQFSPMLWVLEEDTCTDSEGDNFDASRGEGKELEPASEAEGDRAQA